VVDPLAEKTTDWTPYRYGYNNPLKYVDPSGMSEEWVQTEDGQMICDEHITNQADAELVYGKKAVHRAPGYNYTSKDGSKIELMDNRNFKKDGDSKTAQNSTSLGSLIYSGIKGNGSSYFIQYEGRAGLIVEGSVAVGVAFDTHGNIGVYESTSLGLGFILGAATSWSAGASTADNINDLSGWGWNARLVATLSEGFGFAISAKYNSPLYFDNHEDLNGFGSGFTIGLPIQAGTIGGLGGVYVDGSYTFMQKMGSLNEAMKYIKSKAK